MTSASILSVIRETNKQKKVKTDSGLGGDFVNQESFFFFLISLSNNTTSVFGTFVDVSFRVLWESFQPTGWLYFVMLKVLCVIFECICFSILLDFPNLC